MDNGSWQGIRVGIVYVVEAQFIYEEDAKMFKRWLESKYDKSRVYYQDRRKK